MNEDRKLSSLPPADALDTSALIYVVQQPNSNPASRRASLAQLNANLGGVLRTGDVMTGPLTLAGAPMVNLHAASKLYVDQTAALGLLKASNLADLASSGASRTNLGLGNVDNTSDAGKPVSTAQATAIALKAPIANPAFTGVVTTAGQIAFPATQNAASDPNILDDYEEGTFTPLLAFGGSATATYSAQAGRYTKIGRLVTATIRLVTATNGAATGAATITGLPFVNGMGITAVAAFLPGGGGLAGVPKAYVSPGTSVVSLVQYTNGSGLVALTNSDLGAGGTFLSLTVTYEV